MSAEFQGAAGQAEAPLLVAPVRAARRRRRVPVSTAIAVLMLAITAVVIVVVPFLSFYDPYGQDLSKSLASPFQDWSHPLGTDPLGRDTLSRLAVAGRTSLLICVPALLLNILVGVTLGLVAGYFGRLPNTLIMGLADLQLSIPIIILLIMIVAVVGAGEKTLVLVLGLTYWVGYGRVSRVVALALKQREFVQAAKTFGGSSPWIIRKHLLPQLVPQLAILASFDLGVLIIIEASLSYLGLGVQPPTPSWGGMISEGQTYTDRDVWLVIFPSIAIFLLVAGMQILSQRFTGERGADITTRTV